MRKIQINGDPFNLPDNWNELNKLQLIQLCSLTKTNIGVNELKIKLVLLWLDLAVEHKPAIDVKDETLYRLRHKRKFYNIAVTDLVAISNKLSWLFKSKKTKDGIVIEIDSKLIRQLIPEIKIGDTVLHGPADAMSNTVFKEYVHIETFYDKYAQTHDQEYFNKILAVLYRPRSANYDPENPTDDIREALNDNLINSRAKWFADVPEDVKLAVFQFYAGTKAFMKKKYPYVFEEGGYKSIHKRDVFDDFIRLTNALTNDDVTKFDDVMEQNTYKVLTTMDELRRKQKEFEAKMNK